MKIIDRATLCYENYKNNINVYAQSSWCYGCPLNFIQTLLQFKNDSFHVNTTHSTNLLFKSVGASNETLCNMSYKFEEYGVYKIKFDSSTFRNNCHIETVVKPLNSNIAPIVITTIFLLSFLGVFFKNMILNIFGKTPEPLISITPIVNNNKSLVPASEILDSCPNSSSNGESLECNNLLCGFKNTRLGFLDVFRGISVTLMIFVNYGGGKYWYFNHAPWNGLTFADLVFPFFIFIMGFTSTISLNKKLQQQQSIMQFVFQILKRTCLLFIIGFILSNKSADDVSQFRVMGVLQRLAIIYFGISVILLIPKFLYQRYRDSRMGKFFGHCWIEFGMVATLIFLHQAIIWLVKVPGCPRGYMGPGGLDHNGNYTNCVGGVTGYVDRSIFTPNHLYDHPTFRDLYQSYLPFDPEGIMGTLSSIVLAYIGAYSAKIYILYGRKNIGGVIKGWIAMAVLFGLITGFLTSWSKENGIVPINKNLWSASFNTVTASLSLLLLSFLVSTINIYKVWDGKPFSFVGMNPLLIYVGHEIFRNYLPFNLHLTKSYHTLNCHTFYILQDLWATGLWIAVAWYLHRHQIYLSL